MNIDEIKYWYNKRCFSSCHLNPDAVRQYISFLIENVASDKITSDDLRYAQIYLGLIMREKKVKEVKGVESKVFDYYDVGQDGSELG